MTRRPLVLPDPPIRIENRQLRRWRITDASALHRAWHEPSIAAATAVPDDPTADRARAWIAGEERRRRSGLALDLVIGRANPVADPPRTAGPRSEPVDETGVGPERIDGEVGIVVVDARRGFGELGWWLFPEARGRGLAGRFVHEFAHRMLRDSDLRRLFARVPVGNEASERVANRAGMTAVGTTDDGIGVWVLDR